MVINDFYRIHAPVLPDKANSPLIIDPNAVSPQPITSQRFQPIARRNSKGFKLGRCVQHVQFALSDDLNRLKFFAENAQKNLLGIGTTK